MFNFLRNHQTFPKQLQHITAHCQCMMVPISPISICYHLSFFYYSHPSGWKMVTHCGFDMYFLPWWLTILRIFFMFLFGHNTWIPKIKIKRSCHCPEFPCWEHRSSGSYQLLERRDCLSGPAQDKGSHDYPHYWINFKHFHIIQSPSLSMSYIFLHPQSPFFPLNTPLI